MSACTACLGFNLLAAGLAVAAAAIMYRWPAQVKQYTDTGGRLSNFYGDPTPDSIREAKRYRVWAKVGLVLLAAAFIVQCVASFCDKWACG